MYIYIYVYIYIHNMVVDNFMIHMIVFRGFQVLPAHISANLWRTSGGHLTGLQS